MKRTNNLSHITIDQKTGQPAALSSSKISFNIRNYIPHIIDG